MFQDYLFFGVDTEFRYAYRMLHLSNIVNEVVAIQGLDRPKALILGEVLLSGILLSSVLDEEESLNTRVQFGEEVSAVSECSTTGVCRGYLETRNGANLSAERLAENNPIQSVAVRTLRIKKSNGKLYEGVTQSQTSSVESAINEHIAASFQLPTKIIQQCWFDAATERYKAFGVIYLDLPKIPKNIKQELSEHILNLPRPELLLSASDDPDQLVTRIIPGQTKAIKSLTPQWHCPCSIESVENMMRSLPFGDVCDLLAENKPVVIDCRYCRKNYTISLDFLEKNLAERSRS